MTDHIFLGARTDDPTFREMLSLRYANRHGLIAGATGTGKTVTLQCLAEGFSAAGIPVFMADVKGDLTGMAQESAMQDFLVARANLIGFESEYKAQAFPVEMWDLFGAQGQPMRTTVSEIGPLLLSRILGLNDTQEGVLNIAFRIADQEGLLLLDLKDLRAMLVSVGERASELSLEYGNVAPASIGAIQRGLLKLEEQGADAFFGEPALALSDIMRCDSDGRGFINILAADKLMQTPALYATFLLWLLSELFEELPEVGDMDKPKLVFFFDEAHLLFTDAPKSLLEKIEQVVRLIRSKGVGIYFVTQNPADIPETVLSQLGNRIQHALRAFTPQQQKSIRLAAQTYRENPAFKVEDVITELGTGEALVSVLEGKGQPSVVQRTLIRPPSSRLGPAEAAMRKAMIAGSPLALKYRQTQDRHSAYETLKSRAEQATAQAQSAQEKAAGKASANRAASQARPRGRSSSRQSTGEAFVKSVVRQVGAQVGREIIRGLMGAMKR